MNGGGVHNSLNAFKVFKIMNISTLIKKLEELKKEYGDLEDVSFWVECLDSDVNVTGVEVFEPLNGKEYVSMS